MPELPEVETVKRQLERAILSVKVNNVVINDARLIKGISAKMFTERITGCSFGKIIRRGKVLIIQLKKNLFLIIHLRISGWLMLSKTQEQYARVLFKLSNGTFLQFCDQRVLGEIKLVDDYKKLSIIERMGPEPLSVTEDRFIALFTGKKTKIKPLLMDQTFLAGIGNMYAQEALFCAGIHPEKSAVTLRTPTIKKLYQCLKKILTQAIKEKGSSVDTYRQLDGDQGCYKSYLNVYQRKGEPCTRCKKPIVRKAIAGRGTYFCPHCQN